jgi:glycosyltransferase involved in cell wall biosynthesis
MKLLVDARCFQDSAYVRRGIGRNTEGILRHARSFLPSPLEMVALLDPAMNKIPDDLRKLFDAVQYHVTPPPSGDGSAIFFNPSPMTHSPTRILPLLGREHILSCAFSHDLVPLEDPDYYLPGLDRRQIYLAALMALKQYRLHAPNSRHTARSIQEKLGIADSDMVVCGSVLLRSFAAFEVAKAVAHPSICRFKPGEYFIMVAGEDPRKNTKNMLAAHALLAERGMRVPLVIVGLYAPISIERLLQFHSERGGRNRDVQFLHGINDAELCALYYRSKACLCPSLSEGFSMPVVEAMACGAPVLASNCPAQVELVEQADALYSPTDPEAITDAIEKAQREPEWLNHLRSKQANMPQRFAEDEVAARIWMHVRAHIHRPMSPQRKQGNDKAPLLAPRAQNLARTRLAILAPYPHHDTVDLGYLPGLLREVAQWADITVFTDESKPRLDPWIRSFQPLSTLAFCTGDFDRIVTVLGLSNDSRRYFWLAERFGGSCLLYASQLGPFYAEVFGRPRAAAVAQGDLRREVTRSELDQWLEYPAMAGNRFLREVARWADPLVVHSRLAQKEIERNATGSVEFLPPCSMPTVDESCLSPDCRTKARLRLGLNPQRIHLLSSGDHDAVSSSLIVHSLEQLLAWGIDADLHLIGSAPAARNIADQLGIGDHVRQVEQASRRPHRTDWLAAVDMGVYLQSGNVGIPVDLFEMLAAGIPTVANRELVQGFALPSHALEVPDVLSSLLIAEQWRYTIEADRHCERLTPERARFVEERRPARHARALLHMLKVA